MLIFIGGEKQHIEVEKVFLNNLQNHTEGLFVLLLRASCFTAGLRIIHIPYESAALALYKIL